MKDVIKVVYANLMIPSAFETETYFSFSYDCGMGTDPEDYCMRTDNNRSELIVFTHPTNSDRRNLGFTFIRLHLEEENITIASISANDLLKKVIGLLESDIDMFNRGIGDPNGVAGRMFGFIPDRGDWSHIYEMCASKPMEQTQIRTEGGRTFTRRFTVTHRESYLDNAIVE